MIENFIQLFSYSSSFSTSSGTWPAPTMRKIKRTQRSYLQTYSIMTCASSLDTHSKFSTRKSTITNSYMTQLNLTIWCLKCLMNIAEERFSPFRLSGRERLRRTKRRIELLLRKESIKAICRLTMIWKTKIKLRQVPTAMSKSQLRNLLKKLTLMTKKWMKMRNQRRKPTWKGSSTLYQSCRLW